MKGFILTMVMVLFITSTTLGQSISISPSSFKAWGSAKQVTSVSVDFKAFSLHYFDTKNLGLSATPIQIKNIVKGGIIGFYRPFLEGTRINAYLEIGYTFDFGRISYVHISNANASDINKGMDTIKLTMPLEDLF